MTEIGRWIVIFGIVLVIVGALVMVAGKLPGIGKLPGDMVWKRGDFTLYAPIGTMVVVSVVLTLILNVVARWLK
jgi:hypothetical protein